MLLPLCTSARGTGDLGRSGFQLGGGRGSIEPPKTGKGGGVRKRAQLTGPLISGPNFALRVHYGGTAGALRAHVSKTTQRRRREETSSMRMQQHNITI